MPLVSELCEITIEQLRDAITKCREQPGGRERIVGYIEPASPAILALTDLLAGVPEKIHIEVCRQAQSGDIIGVSVMVPLLDQVAADPTASANWLKAG